jgi:prepilin-type N-terminal cleavage/methylation domain-containing protein
MEVLGNCSARRPRGPSRGRPVRGISLVELIVVLAIIGIVGLFSVPAIAKTFRRMQSQTALGGISRAATSARLGAIQGVSGATATAPPTPVVLLMEKGGTGEQIRLRSFVDANQNYAFDTGERVLDDLLFPDRFVYWKRGGTKGSLGEAAPFSTYQPPAATAPDTALANRIVFLPNGAIAVPQDTASARPTKDAGRGIYFADRDGLNYFRVTIYSDSLARPVAEKWVDASTGYATAGWSYK